MDELCVTDRRRLARRPPAPVRYAKPNKLDKPFEATSLYADSFRPIDSSFVPEKRQRRRNG